jgi:hypothetical protein
MAVATLQDLYGILERAGKKGTLSQRSVYVYKSRLKQLVQERGMGNVKAVIANPLKVLKGVESPESRKAYLTTMMSVFTHDVDGILSDLAAIHRAKWMSEFLRVKALCVEKLHSQKPSEAQKKAMIEWQDLLAARDRLVPGTIPHIIVSLYTEVVGRNDWCRIYISRRHDVDSRVHPNYIVLQKGKNHALLCLNNYKTNNTSRHRHLVVSDNNKNSKSPLNLAVSSAAFSALLSPELTASIEKSLKLQPRDYLLTQEEDPTVPYKNKNGCEKRVLKILREALGNPATSINSIRHAYACHIQRDPRLSERDKKKMAAKAMHSGNMNKLYCFVKED